MKRNFTLKNVVTLLFVACSISLFAQKSILGETPQQKQVRMQWFTDAHFGMFIHWGLYALPARHEWVKRYERMTNEQYQTYFDTFDPVNYDPVKWAKTAKAAGMKYMVLTTKHHEGFCLFDSKYTDYKATNTKAKRDLVREYVNACRSQGLKVGFYYSLIDWHHPDFTIDRVHPQEPSSKVAYDSLNRGRDMNRYRTYLRNQVKELLTNYGKIDILWLDFSYPGENGKGRDDWGSVELIKMVRKLQPGIIINNRLDLMDYTDGYDFETPEQVKPEELTKFKGKYWETCQTFSGSWGYYRDENTWKTERQLLDLLITSTANGGNLILNVGPTAKGEFDYRATNALDKFAYWMHANSDAIYSCTYAPDEYALPKGIEARLTYKASAKRLYVHLFDYPTDGKLTLPGYSGKIKYAQFLNDDSELKFQSDKENASDVVLQLPTQKPPYEIPVVELILK
ncbi:MAG: alpha-L-fucosidase [Bacteroidales bacterium]|nr:alpha-L-fucosidase [Bacteroidales bacterium]